MEKEEFEKLRAGDCIVMKEGGAHRTVITTTPGRNGETYWIELVRITGRSGDMARPTLISKNEKRLFLKCSKKH